MGNKENDIQKEINDAFKIEGVPVIQGIIEDNENRLNNVMNAMRVLDFFCGKGLADEMPLVEGIGFLGVEIKKVNPEMNKIEIERARDFLLSIIGEEYHDEMHLGAVMEKLKEEKKDLSS